MMHSQRFALCSLVLVAVASAWTPSHPASKQTTKQSAFLADFRPVQWAAAGIMAASLAFTPLPTHAADAPPAAVADPPTGVTVDVGTNKLIKSIEENKGELNAAVSSVVKDTPSESIKLDPPASKAEAVREALDAGKEKEAPVPVKEEPKAEVKQEPKAEVKEELKAEVKEEPKAEVKASEPAPAPPPEAKKEEPKPAVEEKKAEPLKTEAPIPEEPKKEPVSEAPKKEEPAKAAASVAEAPKKEEPAKPAAPVKEAPKKEEPTKPAAPAVQVPKKEEPVKPAAPVAEALKKEERVKPAAPVAEAPKKEEPAKPAAPVVEAPKKEEPAKPAAPVKEAPKAAIIVSPKKEEAPDEAKKFPSILELIKEKMNSDAPPPAATTEKPPAVKTEAPKKLAAPEPPKPAAKPEAPPKQVTKLAAPETASVEGFEELLKKLASPFKETKEEAARTNFDDVPFLQRPAIRTSLLSPDGKERMNLVFNNAEVASGLGLGIGLTYLAGYQVASISNSKQQDDEPRDVKTEKSVYTGPSYLDRLASTENAPPANGGSGFGGAQQATEAVPPPTPKSSKPKFPSVSVKSTSDIPGASGGASYVDSLSKSNEPPKPKKPTGGGSYLDSL